MIERILIKADEHRRAGRQYEGFRQVFVPKDDYDALVEYFGSQFMDGPLVFTSIGTVSVHPVNPDGATFSD